MWSALILLVLVGPFGLALVGGAPYLPTLGWDLERLLDFAELRAGMTLVDLGSGDGRLLRAAARRGVYCAGYEINPFLWALSLAVTWRYRHLVTIRLRNFWSVPLPNCDVVYVFLLARSMAALDRKLQTEVGRPTTVVSLAFPIPERIPQQRLDVSIHGLAAVGDVATLRLAWVAMDGRPGRG
jgi:hypothetical protein